MEGMLVFLIYVAILLTLTALQVITAKKNQPKHWRILYITNGLAIAGACAAMHIFNSLPGTGMAPGLTWFAETLYSMGAAALYGIQFIITVVLHIITAVLHISKRK